MGIFGTLLLGAANASSAPLCRSLFETRSLVGFNDTLYSLARLKVELDEAQAGKTFGRLAAQAVLKTTFNRKLKELVEATGGSETEASLREKITLMIPEAQVREMLRRKEIQETAKLLKQKTINLKKVPEFKLTESIPNPQLAMNTEFGEFSFIPEIKSFVTIGERVSSNRKGYSARGYFLLATDYVTGQRRMIAEDLLATVFQNDSAEALGITMNYELRRYDLKTGNFVELAKLKPSQDFDGHFKIMTNPKGTHLLVAGPEFNVFDMKTGQEVVSQSLKKRLQTRDADYNINSADFVDDRHILLASNKAVVLYDIKTDTFDEKEFDSTIRMHKTQNSSDVIITKQNTGVGEGEGMLIYSVQNHLSQIHDLLSYRSYMLYRDGFGTMIPIPSYGWNTYLMIESPNQRGSARAANWTYGIFTNNDFVTPAVDFNEVYTERTGLRKSEESQILAYKMSVDGKKFVFVTKHDKDLKVDIWDVVE
jgi:hypothetical protein